MCAISGGSSAPPAETDRPPNIRWSTKRSSRPWSVPASANRTRRCRSGRRLEPVGPASGRSCRGGRGSRHRSSKGSQRYLPRRRAPSIRRPVRAAAKPDAPPGMAAYGTVVEDVDARDRRAGDVALEAGPRRPRPRGAAGAGGPPGQLPAASGRPLASAAQGRGDLAVGGLGGALLGFLLGAAVAVAVELVADPHLRDEGLHVVGAVVLDDVLGNAEALVGRQLLERGLPVEDRRRARRRPRSAGRTDGARRPTRPRCRH